MSHGEETKIYMKKSAKHKKILIVDDNSSILDAIKTMLAYKGYVVTITMDGDIVGRVTKELPDLLLLDIWMSGIDGRDICQFLKNQDITKKVPIILISANKDVAEIAQSVGADDFIEKPFEMKELLEKVEKQVTK
jgi:CheY-like chemotaxis protein